MLKFITRQTEGKKKMEAEPQQEMLRISCERKAYKIEKQSIPNLRFNWDDNGDGLRIRRSFTDVC